MVRTRSQASQLKTNYKRLEGSVGSPDAAENYLWDLPGSIRVDLKRSIIKTYSKKYPLQWISTSKPNFFAPDSPTCVSNPDISEKSKNRDDSCVVFSSSHVNEVQNNADMVQGQSSRTSKRRSKKSSIPDEDCKLSTNKRRNKTTLSLGSMATCTMLHIGNDDDSKIEQPMSLCSVDNGILEFDSGPRMRNSTVIASCDDPGIDFIPEDFSMIEADNDQRTILSCYNEQTPKKQSPEPVVSLKKVKFSVGQASKVPSVNLLHSNARRSILKKTPKRNACKDGDCPRTSSPDPNKKQAPLQCNESILLHVNNDGHRTKDTSMAMDSSNSEMNSDMQKLLEFEPLLLECSENVADCDRDDVTPETCDSVKLKTSTGTRKERRRLSYHPEEDVPACFILDHPCCLEKKKVAILFGRNSCPITAEDLATFPTDILLS